MTNHWSIHFIQREIEHYFVDLLPYFQRFLPPNSSSLLGFYKLLVFLVQVLSYLLQLGLGGFQAEEFSAVVPYASQITVTRDVEVEQTIGLRADYFLTSLDLFHMRSWL